MMFDGDDNGMPAGMPDTPAETPAMPEAPAAPETPATPAPDNGGDDMGGETPAGM